MSAEIAVLDPVILEVKLPKANGITWQDKKQAAVLRVIDKIGQEAVDLIKQDWSVLDSGNGKKDQEKANEMIIALCNLKLSQIEILSILGCGSERISKMRTRITQGSSFVGQGRKPPSHAFKGPTLDYLYNFMDQWEIEVSVYCQHHEHKYFVEEGLTWKMLHERYQEGYSTLSAANKKDIEFMKYSTFTQYVHQKSPGLRLSRPKQDVCIKCSNMKVDSNETETATGSSSSSSSSSSSCVAIESKVDAKHAPAYKLKLLKRKAAELENEPRYQSDKTGNDSDSEDGDDNSGRVGGVPDPIPLELATASVAVTPPLPAGVPVASPVSAPLLGELTTRVPGPSVASQIRAIPASVQSPTDN